MAFIQNRGQKGDYNPSREREFRETGNRLFQGFRRGWHPKVSIMTLIIPNRLALTNAFVPLMVKPFMIMMGIKRVKFTLDSVGSLRDSYSEYESAYSSTGFIGKTLYMSVKRGSIFLVKVEHFGPNWVCKELVVNEDYLDSIPRFLVDCGLDVRDACATFELRVPKPTPPPAPVVTPPPLVEEYGF